jgi:hypothetical protein
VGKQPPEAITNVERALDRELRQIVRQVSARGHGRPLKGAAMRRRRDPAAEAPLVCLEKLHMHYHHSLRA